MEKNFVQKSVATTSRKIVDIAANVPCDKGKLNKESMMYYVVTHGTKEDCVWFAKLANENREVKTNNVRGGTYNGYDLRKIREEFCQRFERFYHLSDKYKRERAIDTYFEDMLKNLVSDNACEGPYLVSGWQ